MNTGASGALDPNSQQAHNHAELYYEGIRRRKGDVARIANNTGFSEDDVRAVKNHVFIENHDFIDGRNERFAPDFDQSQAWQRLEAGTFTDDDITFLNHELVELNYMLSGDVYEIAHEKANAKYNWQDLISKSREV